MKKYIYDGMTVTIKEEKNNGVVMVQPVDDQGRDYGEIFPAFMRDLEGC